MATFDLFRNKDFLRSRAVQRIGTMDLPAKISLAHGFLTALLFITGFFTLKNYEGVIALSELALFYVLFLFTGVFLGALKLASVNKDRLDYQEGLKLGIRISFIAVTAFTCFLCTYLLSNHAALFDIREHLAYGPIVGPFTIAARVLIEGLVSGLIITFSVMQYFKND